MTTKSPTLNDCAANTTDVPVVLMVPFHEALGLVIAIRPPEGLECEKVARSGGYAPPTQATRRSLYVPEGAAHRWSRVRLSSLDRLGHMECHRAIVNDGTPSALL
jgi:hypothetical protein